MGTVAFGVVLDCTNVSVPDGTLVYAGMTDSDDAIAFVGTVVSDSAIVCDVTDVSDDRLICFETVVSDDAKAALQNIEKSTKTVIAADNALRIFAFA